MILFRFGPGQDLNTYVFRLMIILYSYELRYSVTKHCKKLEPVCKNLYTLGVVGSRTGLLLQHGAAPELRVDEPLLQVQGHRLQLPLQT
jgi:hypothetical protein